jgi:hypothetical protein
MLYECLSIVHVQKKRKKIARVCLFFEKKCHILGSKKIKVHGRFVIVKYIFFSDGGCGSREQVRAREENKKNCDGV